MDFFIEKIFKEYSMSICLILSTVLSAIMQYVFIKHINPCIVMCSPIAFFVIVLIIKYTADFISQTAAFRLIYEYKIKYSDIYEYGSEEYDYHDLYRISRTVAEEVSSSVAEDNKHRVNFAALIVTVIIPFLFFTNIQAEYDAKTEDYYILQSENYDLDQTCYELQEKVSQLESTIYDLESENSELESTVYDYEQILEENNLQ